MRAKLMRGLSAGLLAVAAAAPAATAHDQVDVCKANIIATEPVRGYGSYEHRIERTRWRAIEHWRGHVLDRHGPEFANWEAAADKHFHCRDNGDGAITCRLTGRPCLSLSDTGIRSYRLRRWGYGGWR